MIQLFTLIISENTIFVVKDDNPFLRPHAQTDHIISIFLLTMKKTFLDAFSYLYKRVGLPFRHTRVESEKSHILTESIPLVGRTTIPLTIPLEDEYASRSSERI